MNYEIEEILKNIAEGKLEFDACSIVNELNQSSLLPKTSASMSEVLFNTIVEGKHEKNIAIKTFLMTDEEQKQNILNYFRQYNYSTKPFTKFLEDVGSLKYEASVYKHIISTIIANNLSPNFVGFIGYGECKIDAIDLYNKGSSYLINNLRYIKESYGLNENVTNYILENSKLGVLIIQKVDDAISLRKIVKSLNPEDLKKIFFQLFHMLYIMSLFKLNHNDLHADNLLVKVLKTPVKLCYKLNNNVYSFETLYILFVYDWDFASCELLGINQKLYEFKLINDEDGFFNIYRDIYRIACQLYRTFVPQIERKYNDLEYVWNSETYLEYAQKLFPYFSSYFIEKTILLQEGEINVEIPENIYNRLGSYIELDEDDDGVKISKYDIINIIGENNFERYFKDKFGDLFYYYCYFIEEEDPEEYEIRYYIQLKNTYKCSTINTNLNWELPETIIEKYFNEFKNVEECNFYYGDDNFDNEEFFVQNLDISTRIPITSQRKSISIKSQSPKRPTIISKHKRRK